MGSQAQTIVVNQQTDQHPFIVRALWYVFIGIWLSGLVIGVAYVLILTIVLSPLGAALLNYVPQALTLRKRSLDVSVINENGVSIVKTGGVPQRPFLLRAMYFVLIGWWFGALWSAVAWALCAIIIGFPLGIWMLNRIGAVVSLHRH